MYHHLLAKKLACIVQGGPKKWPSLFLSELCQIYTKFDNFCDTDNQDDTIMWGTFIVYLT